MNVIVCVCDCACVRVCVCVCVCAIEWEATDIKFEEVLDKFSVGLAEERGGDGKDVEGHILIRHYRVDQRLQHLHTIIIR